MKFRNIDANGDWDFGRGVSSFAQDEPAIGLSLATRLRSWVGNCFFDIQAGVDYINLLGPGTQGALDLAIQAVVFQTDGVVDIQEYESTLDSARRNLSIKTGIRTIFSPSYTAELKLLSAPPGV